MSKATSPRPRNRKGGHSYWRLVPCRVQPGMFRDEYLVSVEGLPNIDDPDRVVTAQLFVDSKQVFDLGGTPTVERPVDGWLMVSRDRTEGPYARIVFTQPAVPVGERLYVRDDVLRKDVADDPL